MEEADSKGQRKSRKRSRSVSSDDSTSPERTREKKTTANSRCSGRVSEDSGLYGRRIPFVGENSINEILKVVSLQSFSNPRLSLLQDGERETIVGSKMAIPSLTSKAESDSQSDSSEETRKERSYSSSEDAGGCSGLTNIVFPAKSRGKRSDLKNGNMSGGMGKDQRYWEKRQRNNASAKRSRDARRVRELETQIRAEYLEDENYRVKVENEVLREENARLLRTIEKLRSGACKDN